MSQPLPKTLGFFFWARKGPSGLLADGDSAFADEDVVLPADLLDAAEFARDIARDRRTGLPGDAVVGLRKPNPQGR